MGAKTRKSTKEAALNKGEVNDRAVWGGKGRKYNDPDERYDRYSSSRNNSDYNQDLDESERDMKGERGWGRMARQEERAMDNMEQSGISSGVRGGSDNLQDYDDDRHMGLGHHGTADDNEEEKDQD